MSFTRSIEWHKHQAPETWIGLLKEIAFRNPKVETNEVAELESTGFQDSR
jgi:hypothetical protein